MQRVSSLDDDHKTTDNTATAMETRDVSDTNRKLKKAKRRRLSTDGPQGTGLVAKLSAVTAALQLGGGGGEGEAEGEDEEMSPSVDDRLGALPDEVLLEILSLLPVNEAVRSTAISRRWRHLSPPSFPYIDLDPLAMGCQAEDLDDEDERHSDWVRKADETLASHHALIRRCRIVDRNRTWRTRDDRCINRWLDDLSSKGIQALTLHCCTNIPLPEPCLPRAKSLTFLELIGLNLVRRPRSQSLDIGFTAVLTLKLVRVMLREGMLHSIVSDCPHLETLHIESCYRLACCRISAPNNLKCLRLRLTPDTKEVDVDASGLTSLALRIPPWLKSVRVLASQLKACHLHVPKQRHEPNYHMLGTKLTRLLLSVANTNMYDLALSGGVIQCLLQDSGANSIPLPSPIMLEKLSVGLDLNQEGQALFMVKLLECCPCLRELNILVLEPSDFYQQILPFSEYGERVGRLQCIKHCLQKVDMLGLRGGTYELEFAKSILAKATVLKSMRLQVNRKSTTEFMLENIKSMLSPHKASPKAKLFLQ